MELGTKATVQCAAGEGTLNFVFTLIMVVNIFTIIILLFLTIT